MHAPLLLLGLGTHGQYLPHQQAQDVNTPICFRDEQLLLQLETNVISMPSEVVGASDKTQTDVESLAKGRVLAVATHHKTGTVLLSCIADKLVDNVEVVTRYGVHDEHTSLFRHYNLMDIKAYDILKEERNYRLIHVVRDPIALIISGYCYHLRKADTQLVPNTGPKVLRDLSLEEGLVHEAHSEMISTLTEMSGLMNATFGDEQVATIGLEDFEYNFDGTIALIVEFLFGKNHPRANEMVQRAALCNIKNNEVLMKQMASNGHINSKECYSEASNTIKRSKNQIWEDVRAFGHELGFVDGRLSHIPN